MRDLIDRQAAIDKFEPWLKVKGYSEGELNMLKAVLYELKFMPSVQPRNGLWIDIKHTFMTKCSVCDWINNDDSSYNFCPNCGADMRGEQDG